MTLFFVCTGNSARSQMAEGWGRALAPDGVQVWSAGTHPAGMNPFAVEVMKEKGVDISGQRSKSLQDVPAEADYVITLCEEADAECPNLPARKERLAWHLPDPAGADGSDGDRRTAFRTSRDRIEGLVRELFARPEFSG
jgi:arsenate reductase